MRKRPFKPRPNTPLRHTLEERFWSFVVKGPGCWQWTGWTNRKGYGEMGRGRASEGHVIASRVSWEIHNGPIPEGMIVRHKCDNPPCTNPDHLELGTHLDNVRDAWNRGRMPTGDQHWSRRFPEKWMAVRFVAPSSTSHPQARFTDDTLADVRDRLARRESKASIARLYGVAWITIADIANGRSYRESFHGTSTKRS
jgi:hypothetical protein